MFFFFKLWAAEVWRKKERIDLGKQRGADFRICANTKPPCHCWGAVSHPNSGLQGGGTGRSSGVSEAELGPAALHVQDEAFLLLPPAQSPSLPEEAPLPCLGRSVCQDIRVDGPLWCSVFSCATELHCVLIRFLLDQITLFLQLI